MKEDVDRMIQAAVEDPISQIVTSNHNKDKLTSRPRYGWVVSMEVAPRPAASDSLATHPTIPSSFSPAPGRNYGTPLRTPVG